MKHHLIFHGIDTTNQILAAVLSKQKNGNMNTFLADEHNLEANHRTQPLSVDILMGERPLLDSRNLLQDLTFFTALLFGFTMLTRASNYLPISSAAYHLDTEHIAFTVAPLPGAGGSPIEVTADQLATHHRCFSFLS